MIAENLRIECENTRQYYYDCLDGQCKEKIPQAVQTHVSQCRFCREEIHCLDQVMSCDSSSDPDEVCHVSRLNSSLETHFKYALTPVTCALAKRFLPSMASRAIKITIPTPLTVHFEQCPTCREHWLGVQSLDLSDAQLQRLTHCLDTCSDISALTADHLSETQVLLFARADYADFDGSCLEHVCKCISCREHVLAARQTIVYPSMADTPDCDHMSCEDLFDLAFPFGSNPLFNENSEAHEAIVQHVYHCETCSRRLGLLDQMLINLLTPSDSGIVTQFRLNLDKTNDGYLGYPIQVDVQKASGLSNAKAGQKAKTMSVPLRSNLGWMKAAAVVAVLLGVTIFSLLPKAGAGFLDSVYDSTTNVPVVRITVSGGDGSTGSKKHWVFPPNRAVTITEQMKTVYNPKAGLMKSMDFSGHESEIALNSDMSETLQRRIRGLFEVWPIEMSQSATLTSTEGDGLDVYELRWSQGKRTFFWCAHVDHATQRVRKVERFEDDTTIGRTYDVDYPTPAEAETFLRQNQIVFD
jgi:hypothetical protein